MKTKITTILLTLFAFVASAQTNVIYPYPSTNITKQVGHTTVGNFAYVGYLNYFNPSNSAFYATNIPPFTVGNGTNQDTNIIVQFTGNGSPSPVDKGAAIAFTNWIAKNNHYILTLYFRNTNSFQNNYPLMESGLKN